VGPSGFFKCYSCQEEGKWSKLASRLNLDTLGDNGKDYVEEKVTYQLSDDDRKALYEEDEQNEVPEPHELVPWASGHWRGINRKLVRAVGGCEYVDIHAKFQRLMLYLPCNINGEHVGGIKAIIERQYKKQLAYINTAGRWSREVGLFPYDYTKRFMRKTKCSVLMLGEGPRDALNPLQWGIPALSILGTHSWSEAKAELVLALDPELIVFAFDPDDAGAKATEVIYDSFKGEVPIARLNLPPKMDPGKFKERQIIQIKKRFEIKTKTPFFKIPPKVKDVKDAA
jgi:hypothetical protein